MSSLKIVFSCLFFSSQPQWWLDGTTVKVNADPKERLYLSSPKVNFKLSKAGLSLFSFSYTDCLTKAKEPSLDYLFIVGRRRDGFMPFPRGINKVKHQQPHPGFELWLLIFLFFSFPINITAGVPKKDSENYPTCLLSSFWCASGIR